MTAAIFVLAAAVSLAASVVLVSRLERVAARVGLSEAALGLLVALAADSPEVTSAVSATSRGHAVIGAGVVLGSNVFNLAALLGLGALVAGRVNLHRRVILLDGAVAAWVAAATLAVLAGGWGAPVGLALVVVVVVPYLVVSTSPRTAARVGVPPRVARWLGRAVADEASELRGALVAVPRGRGDGPVALASLVVVVAASTVMERTAETMGRHGHLSAEVVGGLILAAVTSLPNAVGAVYLAARGRGAAVLSTALNSNMLNVLAGLLVPGLVVGLGAPTSAGTSAAAWYLGLTLACLALAYRGRGLGRWSGGAVVVAYLAFVAMVAVR